MDLRKTGKLIAKLRNEKGLTQQELGDLIGVGFRAVSKWERGLNLPDISNINELSKIFGISSDELLHGELKEEEITKEVIEETPEEESAKQNPKKKIPLKVKITISVITMLILIITSLIIYNNTKVYVYDLKSINEDDYYVKGQLTLNKEHITIVLDKLLFKDVEFYSIIIHNYEYQIYINDNLIFGYSESLDGNARKKAISIEEFTENFAINYSGETEMKHAEIDGNKLYIKFILWDINSNEITKTTEITLNSQ